MNRRGFLASLAALTLDPERLLWAPGKKLISIPKPVASPASLEIAGVNFFEWRIGDVITFGEDPISYIVTKVHAPGRRSLLDFRPLRPDEKLAGGRCVWAMGGPAAKIPMPHSRERGRNA